MLDHFYAKFDKAYYSGLCKAVAVGEDIYIMGKMCFEEFVKIHSISISIHSGTGVKPWLTLAVLYSFT